jgi:antitoxin component of RelBE/YafQ-DinJ toxin-antitoxin module
MSTVTKTDFIKFNVSPQFKSLAEKKAREHGMTISELGRMLFGAFVAGMAKPKVEISPDFLAMVKEARKDYEAGKGKTFENAEDAIAYLHRL